MIARQIFESYPVFGDNATKVMPDNGGSKYSNGFQQSDVLPAEWMNWAWNKNTKGITDLNEGAGSMEDELINVLNEAGITPSGSATNQVYKALRKNCGCIMASSRTITDAPSIDSNNIVKIMFTADITGSDTITGMTITYNGTGYPVKACKNGTLADFTAHTISGSTKYLQANTILEFVYDGANFIIIGNPVVLSSATFSIFADGKNSALEAHPVNSLYWSEDSTDPAVLFGGGTWTRITNTFVFATNDVSDSGKYSWQFGEFSHQLTIDEMPSHLHAQNDTWNWYGTTKGTSMVSNGQPVSALNQSTPEAARIRYVNQDTNNTGNSQSHNNMPPYLRRYCWQRTA